MENVIKIDRKMLEWEWYKNEHTKNVFLHCLLKAHWKDVKIEGNTIPRGSFISSIGNISEELALTPTEVRTALKHLKLTNEVTSKGTNRNTVFTVTNYDLYQTKEQSEQQTDNKQITSNQQTDNDKATSKKQAINEQLTTNEEYKKKEDKEIITIPSETVNRLEIQKILESWNDLQRYGIKPVSRMGNGTKRYKCLVARIKEYGVDGVLSAIENIKLSDFLQGKNKSGWVITFDWFVLPNNFLKVFDGNYTNNDASAVNRNFSGSSRDEQFQKLMEQIRRDEEDENK